MTFFDRRFINLVNDSSTGCRYFAILPSIWLAFLSPYQYSCQWKSVPIDRSLPVLETKRSYLSESGNSGLKIPLSLSARILWRFFPSLNCFLLSQKNHKRITKEFSLNLNKSEWNDDPSISPEISAIVLSMLPNLTIIRSALCPSLFRSKTNWWAGIDAPV